MGIYSRLEHSVRAESWGPADDRWFQSVDSFASTFAGFPIGPDTAKRVSAVFACVSLIAETIASLPCILYRRLDEDGAKERARNHRLYRTLRFQPNPWMTTMDFFGCAQMHAGLRGNAYSEIKDDGRTIELHPLHPDLVTVEQLESGRVRYEVRHPKTGQARTLLQDRVVHVRDLSSDGFTGQARSALAREAIGVAAAGEAFVAKFFKNDATGRLIIKHPTHLDPKKKEELRKEFKDNYAGWANRSKMMLLTHGVDAVELGKQTDSGFIVDPRKFQTSDIARFWRVPGFMIGLEEKTSSWGTGVAEMKQALVTFTMKPWTDRHAQALMQALLTEEEQEEFFIEFLFADLLRGDLKSQMESYKTGKDIGVWSPNDIRKKLNENPREGGDEYQDTPAGAVPNAAVGQPVVPVEEEEQEEEEAQAIPEPLRADAVLRIANKEIREVEERTKKANNEMIWAAWLEAYFGSNREYTAKVLQPLGEAFAVKAWRIETMVDRIANTGVLGLADGVPDDWQDHRRMEIAAIIDECLCAGVMQDAA